MRSASRVFILISAIQVLIASACLAQAESPAIQSNTTIGSLSAAEYDSITTLLRQYSLIPLHDTIILKYQNDVAPAGNNSATADDEIIQQTITGELRKLHQAMARRKNISIFNFIEPGMAANDMVANNNLAIIETSGILQRLLLKGKNATSSILLIPGRQYICFSGAQGWEALDFTGRQVKQFLAGDLAKVN